MLAVKSHIDMHGKLSIPVRIRKKLFLSAGDEVVIECVNNKLVVSTFKEKVNRARSIINEYIDNSTSLVDELKKMRVEDASKE